MPTMPPGPVKHAIVSMLRRPSLLSQNHDRPIMVLGRAVFASMWSNLHSMIKALSYLASSQKAHQ